MEGWSIECLIIWMFLSWTIIVEEGAFLLSSRWVKMSQISFELRGILPSLQRLQILSQRLGGFFGRVHIWNYWLFWVAGKHYHAWY
jgi:hypothetical protein